MLREGGLIGLSALKKLDVRLRTAGGGGSCAIVSIVRSDKDGLDFRDLSTFSAELCNSYVSVRTGRSC